MGAIAFAISVLLLIAACAGVVDFTPTPEPAATPLAPTATAAAEPPTVPVEASLDAEVEAQAVSVSEMAQLRKDNVLAFDAAYPDGAVLVVSGVIREIYPDSVVLTSTSVEELTYNPHAPLWMLDVKPLPAAALLALRTGERWTSPPCSFDTWPYHHCDVIER